MSSRSLAWVSISGCWFRFMVILLHHHKAVCVDSNETYGTVNVIYLYLESVHWGWQPSQMLKCISPLLMATVNIGGSRGCSQCSPYWLFHFDIQILWTVVALEVGAPYEVGADSIGRSRGHAWCTPPYRKSWIWHWTPTENPGSATGQ